MENGLLANGEMVKQADLRMIGHDIGKFTGEIDWRVEAFFDISLCMNDPLFPCLFARNAWKSEALNFAFVSTSSTQVDVISALKAFVHRTKTVKEEDRLYSPLLMVFEQTGFQNLRQEHEFAWQRIQEMHDGDPQTWPDAIPTDPQSNEWSFCFGGIELFINISCPSHLQLRSRNLGQHVVFVINPRAHFDIVASHKDVKGVKVREKIRRRVCNYNNGYLPKALGFYGDEHNLEWKQYQMNEPGSADFSRCPLHIHNKGGKA
ncbi:YqcI/YcgG family protein [Rouxiella badensis]|jgi:FPC/CPF motif-containing protein YcgG|uniref:YqcI/YcgG family protein n=1 Tax=Rouxiella badensis TaxID=1646377 RepID=UPI0013EEF75E|nr:YqcI/YcgG family protein [Rouxiella badensis]QII38857.1 YqcI/YcgG family protein [Rouxiella badensis]